MATKKKDPKEAAELAGKHLRILNHVHEGYRRAGREFPKGKSEHAPDTFTPEQIELLTADPNLTVEPFDPPKDAGGAAA